MSGIKRMALLFLTLVLLMGVFAGCSSYRKGDETLIMTVGGYEVTGEFYRYVCMKNCVQLYGAEALERPLTEREPSRRNCKGTLPLKKWQRNKRWRCRRKTRN